MQPYGPFISLFGKSYDREGVGGKKGNIPIDMLANHSKPPW